ncbi:ABC transporter permease [Oxalobacter vibrioformis]|uniref:ABC transporter permease n=1 Tax=Oxalobacter vibrioformis TaxID=933080 RepID=A0A9E9P1N1_9BURK|nr:ABC transporter permease [Oxalobacter vibrioformis]WAW09012.1 ABC transporter permease [Oxalobacter vibrioformis]
MNSRPLTTLRISWENLAQRPFRTAGLILIVLVFSFLLFGGSILIESIRTGINSMSQRLGADLMVVPHGYEKQLQSALLRGEPSSFYLEQSLEQKIKAMDGVDKVSSQIFIASLQAACCTLPVQLIGFDPETDFIVTPWIKNSLSRELTDDEIIVGSKIEGEPGGHITFFGKRYRIAARLDRTGMGFDTSVFLKLDTARNMIRKLEIAPLFDVKDLDQVVSSVMVKAKAGQDTRALANTILQRHAMAFNLDMVMSRTMMSDIASRLQSFSLVMYALGGLLWLLATGVLMLVFSIVVNERRREFSLLRVLGASRKKLSGILMTEAFLISLAGSIGGLFLSALIVFSFRTLISNMIGLPFLLPAFPKIGLVFLLSLLVSAGIGPLACLYSAWRLGKGDIYTALRGE